MEPGGQTATASVTTNELKSSDIGPAGATLQGSWSGATGTVYESGFYFGTNASSLTEREDLKTDGGTSASGSFSVYVGGLAPNTTYYYQAYVREWNAKTNDYEYRKGEVKSFTTAPEGQISDQRPDYLSCGEIPAVSLSGSRATGKETFGSTNWYRYGVSGNANQMIVTHTFSDNNRIKRNYTMLYDNTKKAALWSAFVMHSGEYPHLVSRDDSYQYDPALVFGNDYSWQVNVTSSGGSYGGNYTRGHQVASNDRRTTGDQMLQTDYVSNMTPQLSTFNSSGSSDWDDLETAIQNLGYNKISGLDTLYVVTGAIFDAGYSTIEKSGVTCAVPTRYYKCVMKVTYNSYGVALSAVGAAFICEHKATSSKKNITIKELEGITGFDFFTNIPAEIQKTAEETFTSLSSF